MNNKIRRFASFFIAIILAITVINPGYIDIQANTDKEKIINDADIDKPNDYVTYEGEWTSGTDAEDQYHNDEHWSESSNWTQGEEGSYTITFTGTKIQLYGNKAPKIGDFKVWIDDKLQGTYSAKGPTRITKQKIFESDKLTNAEHKIKVQGVFGTGNIHFDYAAVTYEEIEEVGKCALQAADLKKGVVNEVTLQFKEMLNANSYLAGEFYITYDKDVLHYVDASVEDQYAILNVKDEDGRLHIVVSSQNGIYNDFTISLKMIGKKTVEQTQLNVTEAMAADASGEQFKLKLATLQANVTTDEQVEQAYKNLQNLVAESNKLIENGALDNVDEVIAEMFRLSLDDANAILNNQTALLKDYIDAWNTLSNAMHLLQTADYKVKLTALIAEYQKLDLSKYEEPGVKQFNEILEAAKKVSMNENASLAELMQTYNDLLKAKDLLIEKTVNPTDKTYLESILKIAEEAEKQANLYDQKDPSWKTFVNAIKKAKIILNDASATQTTVDNAADILTDAYENIRLLSDKRALAVLKEFIDKANKVNSADYTKDDYNYIISVKLKAEKVYKNFSEESYRAIKKEILKALDIIQNHKLNEKDEQKKPAKNENGIDTGDDSDRNLMGFGMILLLSAGCILYLKRKSSAD